MSLIKKNEIEQSEVDKIWNAPENTIAYPHKFRIGTRPLCAAKPSDCDAQLGYRAEKVNDTGCMTGSQYDCVFDIDLYKQGEYYKSLVSSKGVNFADTHLPIYKEYGTAPFCGGTRESAAFDDKIYPIIETTQGFENYCVTGKKIIGVSPVTKEQENEVKRLSEEHKRKEENSVGNKILDKLVDTGIGIVTGIAKALV